MCRGVPAEAPSLPDVLSDFAAYSGVSVQWVFFGSAGHVERPPGGALVNYDKCTGKLDIGTKCFANMKHAAPPLFRGDKAVHHCSSSIPARDSVEALQAWPQVRNLPPQVSEALDGGAALHTWPQVRPLRCMRLRCNCAASVAGGALPPEYSQDTPRTPPECSQTAVPDAGEPPPGTGCDR